jgi:hypothetical protein
MQLRILRCGLLQDGNIRVGILLQREEVLMRNSGFGGVTLQCVGGFTLTADNKVIRGASGDSSMGKYAQKPERKCGNAF